MSHTYSAVQLDALREVANIGSGTAGTALSSMLGRAVDLSVPQVLALPLAEAVEALGDADATVTAVVIPIFGAMDAVVVLLFTPEAADTLCALLGVDPRSEVGRSALSEIGNILGTSYVGSIEEMTGLHLEPRPPQALVDLLGAVVSSVLTYVAGDGDVALVMDSDLRVEGEACSLSFVLVPSDEGVTELLDRLGMGEMTGTETVVRMGEYAATDGPGDVLVTIGLGSCIGLVLVDPARGIAGLAHVMLPASPAVSDAQLGKYADTAVPALLERMIALGARPVRLDAVLVGGAQMFSFGGGSLDVGARNAQAVTAAIVARRIPIRATATGGSSGRTVRVDVAAGAVSVRCAGQPEENLFSPALARR